MRVYFLSWLRNKILKNDPAVGKKPGFSSIGDPGLEGTCFVQFMKKYYFQAAQPSSLSTINEFDFWSLPK